MSFGQDYARAYDAFYRTKDYPAEARFVCETLRKVLGDKAHSILDLGCGTGLHDIELVGAKHSVIGADLSAGMLARAQARRAALPAEWQNKLHFIEGDARTLKTGATYDAVISLFHVMSYMAGEGDFDTVLANARLHLKPGGALLFDFWYGPAVLADPPQRRERKVEEEGRHICRVTTPHWDKAHDTVRIDFDVSESAGVGETRDTHEEHIMRYFFEDGLRQALPAAGFDIVEFGEWLTGKPPHNKTFGAYILARAVA